MKSHIIHYAKSNLKFEIQYFKIIFANTHFLMMKKRAAIFFILLANIVLLVHAVVPHHHHESSVCIENVRCNDCDVHKHAISQNCCHHGNESNSQNCVLKLVVFLPSNQEKQDCKCLILHDKKVQPVHLSAVLFTQDYKSYIPPVISDDGILLGKNFFSRIFSESKGLRAPPIV